MTTTELVLVILLGAALVALVALLRGAGRDDVSGRMEAQSAQIARLADALGRRTGDDLDLRGDLGRTREVVEAVRAGLESRRRAEEDGWATIGRLEAVLLGGGARGRPGENLLEEALSLLPPGMLVRDFAVGGKRVEFALALPDGRRLPIDSKWTASRGLEALEAEEDPEAVRLLCRRVEDEVARRSREVATYLDPALTTPFAVAAVPDAAFAVCRKAHADAFARGVVLVPYATALPVVLALYTLSARHGESVDTTACFVELEGLVTQMEVTLENKVARATSMLQNAADEWRTHVGRARGALARGRSSGENGEVPPVQEFVAFEPSGHSG
ncbi:MAG: DNA recombination protein RmuC [Actinomycetota bacterium]